MDTRVKVFREEASRQGVGRAGRRYPAQMRAMAVALAQERSEEPLGRVAADLGVSALSLQRWIEKGEPARFRPIEVEPEVVASARARDLVLITPSGYRVEGLETETLSSLLRVLG
jgi:transposase-like protein